MANKLVSVEHESDSRDDVPFYLHSKQRKMSHSAAGITEGGTIDIPSGENITIGGDPITHEMSYHSYSGHDTGGVISINADPTKFDVSAGHGYIIDNSNPDNKITTKVEWTAKIAVSATYLTSKSGTFIGTDSNGDIVQQVEDFKPGETNNLRNTIRFGRIGHFDRTTISQVFNYPYHFLSVDIDYACCTIFKGTISVDGGIISNNGANLKLDFSKWISKRIGANYDTDKNNPNIPIVTGISQFNFFRAHRSTSNSTILSSSVSDIDPTMWDDGSGTLQAVAATKYTIQEVILFPNNTTYTGFVVYGQELYNNFSTAYDAIFDYRAEIYDDIAGGASRALILIKGDATDIDAEIAAGRAIIREISGESGVVGGGVNYWNRILAQVQPKTITDDIYTEGNVVGDDIYISDLNTSIVESYLDSGFLCGFVDRDDSTLSFVVGTRTLTIAPAVTSFDIYEGGKKYTKSASENIIIGSGEGFHTIYYLNGVLTELYPYNEAAFKDVVINNASVCYVYYDATNIKYILFEERHGVIQDGETHWYLHTTQGAKYLSGYALADFVIGDGSLDSHAQFTIESGVIADEDLETTSNQILSTAGTRVLYSTITPGVWRWQYNTGFNVLTAGTGRLAWDNNGVLTEANNLYHVCYHTYAWNDYLGDPVTLVGQNQYATAKAAREGALTEISNINVSGLPSPEMHPVATVILQTRDTYANAVKSKIILPDSSKPTDYYIDWTKTDLNPSSSPADHGFLGGLLDDDHINYLFWPGRSGGQSIYGGIAASDNLTFYTTTDATKGSYVFSELADGLIKSATGVITGGNSVDLSSEVTGILPVINGGTGNSSNGDLTGSGPVIVNNGTGAVLGSGSIVTMLSASAGIDGYLSSTDWITFNGKQDALSFPLSLLQGGTGIDSSSSIDGQLLIGGTTSNDLQLATLTAGTGISIVNGTNSITITSTSSGSFSTLSDVSGAYTTAYSLYAVNGTTNGLQESTTLLTEPAANQFKVSRGTTDLLVTADCTIDQDLQKSASPTFDSLTLGEYLYHNGDTDTNLRFQTDQFTVSVGDTGADTYFEQTFLDVTEVSTTAQRSNTAIVGGVVMKHPDELIYTSSGTFTYKVSLTTSINSANEDRYFKFKLIGENASGNRIDMVDVEVIAPIGTYLTTADHPVIKVTASGFGTQILKNIYCVRNTSTAWLLYMEADVVSGYKLYCRDIIGFDRTIARSGSGTSGTLANIILTIPITRGQTNTNEIYTTTEKIGVGTTSPQELVHALNDAGEAIIEVESSYSGSDAAIKMTTTAGSYGWYVDGSTDECRLYNYNTSDDIVTIGSDGNADFDGNIGINTATTPTLDFGDSYRILKFDVSNFNMSLQSPGDVSVIIDNNNNSTTEKFSVRKNSTSVTGGTEIFRIKEDGTNYMAGLLTLQGTASPLVSGRLTLNHLSNTTGIGAVNSTWSIDSYPANYFRVLNCNSSGTYSTNFQIAETGGIYFPNLSAIAGAAYVQYSTSTNQIGYLTSALRYKTNITDMEDTSWLYDLRPVNFENKKELGIKRYGLIAEEVELINKSFCCYSYVKEKYKDKNGNTQERKTSKKQIETVSYSSLITPMLNEIQKLKERIDLLESK